MKNLLKNFAFYAALLFVTSISVKANDILKEGAVNQMENFLYANKKEIVSGKSWNTIKNVLKLYNDDKTGFQSLNVNQINVFNLSVSDLNKKLLKIKNDEATKWINILNETSEILNRRWNFDFNSILPKEKDEELVQVPSWFNLKSLLPIENDSYDQISENNVPDWFNLKSLLPVENETEVQLNEQVIVPAWFDLKSLLPKEDLSTEERIVE